MAKIYNQAGVTDLRRRLRSQMPPAEVLVWSRLQGKQLHGCKFRRQYSVGSFVLDFYCPSARLAIELDGDSHVDPAYDRRRQEIVESFGISFLRFTNEDVTRNLDGVMDTIYSALGDALQTSPSPSLSVTRDSVPADSRRGDIGA